MRFGKSQWDFTINHGILLFNTAYVFVRLMLRTCSTVQDCVVQNRSALCIMVNKGDLCIFVVDNAHANQGSKCSSVLMQTLVVHNIALYWLGGAQDDFACLLSALTVMMRDTMLSVYWVWILPIWSSWSYVNYSITLHKNLTKSKISPNLPKAAKSIPF